MRTLDIELTEPQSRAWRLIQPHTTTTLLWGRGTGKSKFMRLVMWMLLAKHRDTVRVGAYGEKVRGVRVAWVMPTLKSFRDVHEQLLTAENEGPWSWLGGRLNKSTLAIDFPNGSWVKPVPAKDHTGNSGRGLRPDVALADEFDDCGLSVWDSIVEPWFTEPWTLGIRVPGGTPRRGRHGNLYRLFKLGESGTPGYHAVHATYLDSPETVSREAAEKAKRDTPGPVFAREWLADPDSSEGLVFQFDERFHVREPPPEVKFHRLAVGVDHGWTDPGCYLLFGIAGHGDDATLWALDEVYATEKTNEWWNDRAVEWQHHNARWYCDPSRPDRIADLRKIVSARKGENAIEAGVARVADLMAIREPEHGSPFARFYVSAKCRNLIRELGQYRRKKDPHASDAFLEDIEDRNNHCLAAGTMVATARGEVPIESVTTADMVMTRAGWRRVLWSGKTFQAADVIRVELSNGRSLVGTGDHLVWTCNRGWVRLDSLCQCDTLLICQDPNQTQTQRSLSSTESASSATPTPHGLNCAGTSPRKAGEDYTERSGRPTTARSQKDSTFITRTGTRSTTLQPIWNACHRQSTIANTKSASLQSAAFGEQSTPQESAHSPRRGTLARRGWSGTGNTPQSCGMASSQPHGSANCAGQSTRTTASAGWRASAPTTANPNGGAGPGSMTLTVSAPSAGQCSGSTDTPGSSHAPLRVLARESLALALPVYDLTVDESHEFFANGALVHNSIDPLRYVALGEFGPLGGPRRDTEWH